MNSLDFFNHYYESTNVVSNPASLRDFYLRIVSPKLHSKNLNDIFVLDLGAGSKSIFEDFDIPQKNITAVDFSDVAVALAREKYKSIQYEVCDLSREGALLKNKYDLIFDSHCLHCIEGIIERKTAFENILTALTDDGIFCAEMMIQSGSHSSHLPYKHIPSALELERELIEANFKISYFFISRDMKFYNENGECDLLRVICKK